MNKLIDTLVNLNPNLQKMIDAKNAKQQALSDIPKRVESCESAIVDIALAVINDEGEPNV